MTRPVVVGVDGSPPSLVAAEHAAQAAVWRSRPLHLVHGYLHPLGYGVPINPYEVGVPAASEDGRKMLEQTAAELVDRWPGLTVEVRQVAGGPGATLVEESRRAELVVVGSRGLGGFAGLLLGSVGTQIAAHGHCPVLVIRPPDRPLPTEGPVLVGVDGSESAELAVGYGAEEAAGAVERWCWCTSPTTATTPGRPRPVLATAGAAARGSRPGLTVQERLIVAPKADQALIEATGDAALVVAGSRGRGGFAGLLLGSVSQTLVHHARCPVLIAHPYQPEQ